MKVLITGAAGFAGSHIAEELRSQGHETVALDNLSYSARLEWLKPGRHVFHDLREEIPREKLDDIGPVDVIVHNAAQSHVSRAIRDPEIFLRSNALGTFNMLEAARELKPRRFIYVSTDEVLGPSDVELDVDAPLNPTNPYSASKAAGEYMCRAHRRAFGVPTMITRTCNMFGPRQHVEKFVPLAISKIIRDEPLEIHKTKDNFIGCRRWCHVSEQARAISYLSTNGRSGETYHVSAGTELTNLAMAELLGAIVGKKITYSTQVSNRPFYDARYRLKESSLVSLWKSTDSVVELLRDTVDWYRSHAEVLN